MFAETNTYYIEFQNGTCVHIISPTYFRPKDSNFRLIVFDKSGNPILINNKGFKEVLNLGEIVYLLSEIKTVDKNNNIILNDKLRKKYISGIINELYEDVTDRRGIRYSFDEISFSNKLEIFSDILDNILNEINFEHSNEKICDNILNYIMKKYFGLRFFSDSWDEIDRSVRKEIDEKWYGIILKYVVLLKT